MKYFEIAVMKLAVYFLKKGWGANCEDEDPEWSMEFGCQSCFAARVIRFLEKDIEYTREGW